MAQATTEKESIADSFSTLDPKTGHFLWDSKKFYNSLSPAGKRNWDRRHRVWNVEFWAYRHIPWLHWHVIGVAATFWTSLAREGVRSTLHPNWGAMSFAYLNDGMKPTLWHTIQQIFFHDGPYSGIWVGGAPKSKEDAERKLAGYKSRREETSVDE